MLVTYWRAYLKIGFKNYKNCLVQKNIIIEDPKTLANRFKKMSGCWPFLVIKNVFFDVIWKHFFNFLSLAVLKKAHFRNCFCLKLYCCSRPKSTKSTNSRKFIYFSGVVFQYLILHILAFLK